jgi:hypothetical protein
LGAIGGELGAAVGAVRELAGGLADFGALDARGLDGRLGHASLPVLASMIEVANPGKAP